MSTAAPWPKRKFSPSWTSRTLTRVAKDLTGEGFGGEAAEFWREGKHQRGVEPGGRELLELGSERGDEDVRGFGTQHAHGVWIEGEGEGLEAQLARACVDLVDDPAMAAVDAVEVADGGDDGAEIGGEFVGGAEDLHCCLALSRYLPKMESRREEGAPNSFGWPGTLWRTA